MNPLEKQDCVACGKDARPVGQAELRDCLEQLPGWEVVGQQGGRWLEKTFVIKPYTAALAFVQAVGELAEQENHHPDITLVWGRVTLKWWTHTLHDIHLNDCIMAARCETIQAVLERG